MIVKIFKNCIAEPRRGELEAWQDHEGRRFFEKTDIDKIIIDYIGFGKTLVVENDKFTAVVNAKHCYIIEKVKYIYYEIRGIFEDMGFFTEKFDKIVFKETEYETVEIDTLEDIKKLLKK